MESLKPVSSESILPLHLLSKEEEYNLAATVQTGLFFNSPQVWQFTKEKQTERLLKTGRSLSDINLQLEKIHKSFQDRVQEGKEAKNELITRNRGLAIFVARKYLQSPLPIEDLIQEASLGLIRAAEKFDPTFGTRFSTYAIWWCRQSINRAIANNGREIRIPESVLIDTNALKAKINQLSKELGQQPTIEQITINLNIPKDQILEFNSISGLKSISLFSILDNTSEEDGQELIETIPNPLAEDPEQVCINNTTKKELESLMVKVLTKKERDIIKKRIGWDDNCPLTLDKIGECFGIGREGARKIFERARRKLYLALRGTFLE